MGREECERERRQTHLLIVFSVVGHLVCLCRGTSEESFARELGVEEEEEEKEARSGGRWRQSVWPGGEKNGRSGESKECGGQWGVRCVAEQPQQQLHLFFVTL